MAVCGVTWRYMALCGVIGRVLWGSAAIFGIMWLYVTFLALCDISGDCVPLCGVM